MPAIRKENNYENYHIKINLQMEKIFLLCYRFEDVLCCFYLFVLIHTGSGPRSTSKGYKVKNNQLEYK